MTRPYHELAHVAPHIVDNRGQLIGEFLVESPLTPHDAVAGKVGQPAETLDEVTLGLLRVGREGGCPQRPVADALERGEVARHRCFLEGQHDGLVRHVIDAV